MNERFVAVTTEILCARWIMKRPTHGALCVVVRHVVNNNA